MQVNNNYQPSFRAGIVTTAAEMAIKKRMSAKKAEALIENFKNTYKDSELDVILKTTAIESTRLDATIRHKGRFRRYIEETILSSIFCSPKKFAERINNVVEKEVKPRLNTDIFAF